MSNAKPRNEPRNQPRNEPRKAPQSPPRTLGNPAKRELMRRAHALKPVVLLGAAGLTEPVLAEIELALDHHELIKVRVNGGDRAIRDIQVRTIVEETGAALMQRIGNIAVLYRANPALKEPIPLPG